MEFRYINIDCPRCKIPMEWAAADMDALHIVDYHCYSCAWKGDYNHFTNSYDEYSSEDYVFSENFSLQQALDRIVELGGESETVDDQSGN